MHSKLFNGCNINKALGYHQSRWNNTAQCPEPFGRLSKHSGFSEKRNFWAMVAFVGRWYVQEDNALIHCASNVQEWENRNRIERILWPAYNPGLNTVKL